MPILIAIACCAVPIAGDRDSAVNPNELSRIALATAIVESRSAAVDEPFEVYGTSEDRAEKDGRSYSDKAPGLSLLAVPVTAAAGALLPREEESRFPAYWPLRNVLTFILVALPSALLPFVLLRGHPSLGKGAASWFALIPALATPMLTYGSVFFGHATAACLCALAWRLALRPGLPRRDPSAPAAAPAGLLAGFAICTEYPAALLAAVIFGALVWRRTNIHALAAFIGGACAGVLPLLVYNAVAFGSPWTMGYAFEAKGYFQAIRGQRFFGAGLPTFDGLYGALFSARRGILYYCPLFLLVPLGLAGMARRCRGDAAAIAVASALFIAFVAGLEDWHGGWCAATRHLVPILPLWTWPLAEAFVMMQRSTWTKLLFGALTAISLAHALLSLAVTPFFPMEFRMPLAQVTLRSLTEGAAARSWLGADSRLLIALWSAVAIAACAVALVRASGAPPRRGAVVVTMIAAILLTLGIEWTVQPPPTTELEKERAFLLDRLGYPDLAQRIMKEIR